MLKRYRICDGRVIESDSSNGDIHVYTRPDEAEKRKLIDELKIDEHTLNSALDPDELSRLEFEPDHLALIFKRPRSKDRVSSKRKNDDFLYRIYSIGLFLFKDRIIILEADDSPIFEGKLFAKIQSLPEIVIKLLYRSIFMFTDHLKRINTDSSSLEEKINTSTQNRYIIDMFRLEKSLVYYLNAINSNTVVIEKLKINAAKIGFTQDNIELLDDLMIENNQCYRQAKIYSDILSGMMDAWASVVSNNLNIVMKTLTIITVAVMVPTFVVSAFSMNVTIPLVHDNPISFWIIMGMATCSLIVVLLFWWYKKW
jgi:magnesium transporter